MNPAFFQIYLGSESECRQQPATLSQASPTPPAAGEVVKPGRYITKVTILEIYDAPAESIRLGASHQTRTDPPPPEPRCCHPPRT